MGAVEFFSIALPASFWPIVVLLFAWWQRKSIGRLIDRVRKGRLFGQEFDTTPPPDLAEAVEGGASSPEVQEVIRSVAEAARQANVGEKSSINVGQQSNAEEPKSLAERLRYAQRLDEDRRRSEIERVMQSSARWGAKVARSRPNDDIDAWEPLVRWQDGGEPEIVAIFGRREHEARRRRESMRAAEAWDLASREADDANRALREASEPSAELRERAISADMLVRQARDRMVPMP